MLRLKSLFFKPRGRHSLKKQGRPQEESVCKKHSASPGGSGWREGRGSASVTPVGDLLVQLGWLTPPDHPPAAAATVCSPASAPAEERNNYSSSSPADWKVVAMTRQKTTATKLATSLVQQQVLFQAISRNIYGSHQKNTNVFDFKL